MKHIIYLVFTCIVSFVTCIVTNNVVIEERSSFEEKRASSCSQLWLRYNITQSGNYTLDLSPHANSTNLVGVECDLSAVSTTFDSESFSITERVDASLFDSINDQWVTNAYYEILTIIHHDSEETKTVKGYESPGSFIRDVNYYTVQSLEQIERIINSSFTCQQFIRWDCCGSTFSFWYPKTHHSWWVDRHGKGQNYWGNAEPNSNSCGCFPNCTPTTKNSTCNCDANLKSKWLEDSGLLLEKGQLPVTQLRFGDTGETREVGSYTLGPLMCRQGGHRSIFMGSSQAPTVISSPGYPDHYPPAFRIYEWQITVATGELIELVFPEYDVVHYGSYISVSGCSHALEIQIYCKDDPSHAKWKHVETIKRAKASPPYYVTDGRATKFIMKLITCNQVVNVEQKGFKAEFRRSKCAGCNADTEIAQDRMNIGTACFIGPSQCVYIYSTGYPFPHYLYGTKFNYHLLHHWNLTTKEGNSLQIEFNDFDVNSTPGQNNCDADLLTVQDEPQDKNIVKKVDYCNINRFNIGKFNSASHMTIMKLKTRVKKVGNSRGIHATIASIPATSSSLKWVSNAAKGKPTDQSTTIDSRDSSLAVDGILEQRDASKCSSTGYEEEPWWRVNLQKRHRIHGIKIYSLIHRKQSLQSSGTGGTSERLRKTIDELDGGFSGSQEDTEISWPSGEYGLPMPVSGCPTNDASSEWLTGMRFHAVKHDKTYDEKAYPYWSESIMLKGGATKLGIEQHFCMHSTLSVPSNESDFEHVSKTAEPWMPGKYCIFQYGDHCLEGFQSGSITWFDKSHNNQTSKLNLFNSVHGHVPSGHYTTHNTTINFCCRDDGQPEVPIRLPKTRPFYLLQYGQICQEVEGMSEVGQYFHYEEEVILTSDHSSSRVDFIYASDGQLKFQDLHPRVDAMLFDRGMSLHYCYYDITHKLKGFQVLVDTTQDTFGYGRFYDEESGIARSVNKKFLSAVECASYSVTANEFEHITLNCAQPIEGQYVIIFMKDRKDALQLCEVKVFGEESCGRPLGMATEEILDTAITASSFDTKDGLLNHYYNVRQNSPKAWCAAGADPDKYIQIDLRLQNSNVVSDSKASGTADTGEATSTDASDGGAGDQSIDLATNYVTIVGVAMQGMQNTFKIYFVTQFQLLFSNDSIHWIYEEEPIGKQKIYKCVQCDAQHINGNEVVMYNLLKPIVARFIRVQIVSFRGGPCMRLELIGCRGDRKNLCYQTVTASTPGVISSPNYPFYYAQYKSCVWKIVPSKPSGHIELDFIVLDLAPEEKSGGKCHDKLVIHHANRQSPITIEAGAAQLSTLQQRSSSSFRQQYFPKKIISNGPMMLTLSTCFRFSMSRYQGFLLRFRETDCPGCGIGDARCSFIHNCSSLCGRILSINYPLNYINSHRCQWLIRAPPGYYFNVTIEDFDLPDKPAALYSSSIGGTLPPRKRSQSASSASPSSRSKHGCMFDHLSFTDYSNGMLLGRYCNSNKPPKYILSNWNELMIEFSTDSSITGRGFRLKYKAQKYQLLEKAKPLLQPPQPNFTCPTSWLYFRGYCYAAFVENESLQWYQAEEKCSQKVKGRDGHLVSITDYVEMNVVHYWIIEHWKMTPHQSIYIGLIDTNREGFYNWSDGNPMSYTDWYRSNPYQSVSTSGSATYNSWTGSTAVNSSAEQSTSTDQNGRQTVPESEQPMMSLDEMNHHFIQNNQPDGGAFEDCTVINFYSIHSTANWHDIPCSLGKKVIPVKMQSNLTGGNSSNGGNSRRPTISDGLIRSYICKMDSTSSLHQHSPRKALFTKQISEEEKAALANKVNRNRYFVCNNFEVISNMFRCDGMPNCRDASDETEGCPTNSQQCLESQFQCDSGHCIAIGKYCNFIDDCGDGSDEVKCVRRRCRQQSAGKLQEFKCNNGQCIPMSKRCDLMPDCLDGSDEGQSCTGGQCNLNKTFQCYFGTCVPLYTLCDKHRDCPGKFYEDEHESVCAALFDLENGSASGGGGATQASGNEDSSAFDLMRSPLRSPPPTNSRFFRMKREDEVAENDDDETVTLSAYIASQMQSEKVRTIREANNLMQTVGQSCEKNRRRTCQDLLEHFGINSEGYYELQPNSQTKLTIQAYCRFLNSTHAMTIMHHDTEDRLYVRSSVDGPGSYVRSITYESSINLIIALIDHSAQCRQLLSYECSGSGFYFNSSRPNSWWTSRFGIKEYNWGGNTVNACACHPHCSPPDLRCNCDSGQRFNWTRDFGYVEDRAKLPIRKVVFGDVSRIGQLGYVRVGELECTGNEETATSETCAEQSKLIAFSKAQQQAKQFQCQSGHVINASFICLYEFDQLGYQIGCRDVSHLANCELFECPADYVKCPGSYCIPHRYSCNGKWDCISGSDEIDCARYTCPGRYKCANESSCILLHQLCDNFRHCPLGDDEWLCDLTCPPSCICTEMYVNCRNSNITLAAFAHMSKETRKLDLSGNHLGPDLANIDFSPFVDLGELILHNNDIEIIRERKFVHLTNLYKLDLRHNRIKVIEDGAFAGLGQVRSLLLEDNPTLEEIQSSAFVGLVSLIHLNISNTRLSKINSNVFLQMSSLQTLTLVDNQIDTIEKGAFNELTWLTSLDLRGNTITNFPKDMFSPMKPLKNLSTDSFKFCCLANSVVGLPFSRCFPPQDEISDCQDLMSNTVQRLILWVLGIVAFFGNLLVVIWRFKTRNQTNRVSSTLILSLGCSDFLMGVYLLIIASVDEYYRGSYIEHSDYWKTSFLCQICGFLSTISSEMSVATLVYITIDRLISISFSFSGHRFTLKFTKRLLFITWVFMFLVSAVPLLPIAYFKGQFYSRSGVCLALHITTRRSPGWEYSVAVFLFANLAAFILIVFCYCYMYSTINRSKKKMKSMITQKQDREARIGWQMLYIVFSNFCCWCPVIIMGMLALGGISISGSAYSWTAVFVLPLNSATDPLIYTLIQFIQNFYANREQERQMLLATAGHGSSRQGRGALFRLAQSSMNGQGHAKILRGFSKLSSEVMAESSISSTTNGFGAANSNLLLRSSSLLQANALLLRPPSGYQTLGEFVRTHENITTRDLLEVCHSVSGNLKEFHQMGFALGTIGFENIFVTKEPVPVRVPADVNRKKHETSAEEIKEEEETANATSSNEQEIDAVEEDNDDDSQIEYRFQTYIPAAGYAYKVAYNDEDVDDYAVNVEEFGLVVKRMLQHYHARQMQKQTAANSQAKKGQENKTEERSEIQ